MESRLADTGTHAAVFITLIVVGVLVVLPVLCCLGLGLIEAIGGHAAATTTR